MVFSNTSNSCDCRLEFSDLRTEVSDNDLFRLVDLDSSSSASGGAVDLCGSVSSSPCPADGGVSADPAMTSGVAQHRKQVEGDLATRVAKDTMVFRLGPGDQVDVRVSFRPVVAGAAQCVLLVRNNLTVVDAVLLRGAGGQGAIKFGNRKPDAATATPLTFSLAAKHLKDCDGASTLSSLLCYSALSKPRPESYSETSNHLLNH